MAELENTPKEELLEALPEVWRQIAESIPVGDVLKIIESFGGTVLYIPSGRKPSYKLKGVIENNSFDILVKEFSGDRIYVPTGAGLRYLTLHKKIITLSKEGWSANKIARHLSVSDRTVFSHFQKHNASVES